MDQRTNPNAGVIYRGSLCVAYALRCTQIYSKCADVLHHQYRRTHYVIGQAIIFQSINEGKQGYSEEKNKNKNKKNCLFIDVLILGILISIENHTSTLLFHSSNHPTKCAKVISISLTLHWGPLKIMKNDKGEKGLKVWNVNIYCHLQISF